MFKKPITLHFYTWREDVYETAKPKVGGSVLPDWWSSLPSYSIDSHAAIKKWDSLLNVRTCPGIVGALTRSIVVPMWSDLLCNVTRDGCEYQYSDRMSEAGFHQPEQLMGFYDTDKLQHIKLTAPWLTKCDENIDWMWMDCTWHRTNHTEYMVPPGLINFKYNRQVNVNMFFHKLKDQQTVLIPHQQPLFQVVPLSDRPVRVKAHMLSRADFVQMQDTFTHTVSFMGAYKKIVSGMKSKWN